MAIESYYPVATNYEIRFDCICGKGAGFVCGNMRELAPKRCPYCGRSYRVLHSIETQLREAQEQR